MYKYYNPLFAQAYGEGSFGTCGYNETTGGCVAAGSSASGGLSNTGFLVVVIVTVAAAVMLVAILVRFWRRSSQTKLQSQEMPVEEIDARPGAEEDDQPKPHF